MDRKQDLDTDEICYAKVRDESTVTPRLHAELVVKGHKKSRIRNVRKLWRKNNEQEFSFTLIGERFADIQAETLSMLVLR